MNMKVCNAKLVRLYTLIKRSKLPNFVRTIEISSLSCDFDEVFTLKLLFDLTLDLLRVVMIWNIDILRMVNKTIALSV